MMEPTTVEDSTKLTDLAAVWGLEGFETVAEQTGLETVGDLRDAAFESLIDTRDVLDVSFERGTVGSSDATVTIEAGSLDNHLNGEDAMPIEKFASQVEVDQLTLAEEQ